MPESPPPHGDQNQSTLNKFRLFSPILAGASLKERLIGCVGALVGIILTGFVCAFVVGDHPELPLIVAPVGASAVLLFAVPASPLAQPWSIIGGNTISALVGVIVTNLVSEPMLAIGLAVGLAILAMSLTRSLHPPGGAAALTAVIGGAAVARSGFWFPFIPVAINSVILVLIGILFHRMAGRQYPHRALPSPVNTHGTDDPPAALRTGFTPEDVDSALAKLNETLDVSRADIEILLREVEMHALLRQKGELTCADIMSRDVVTTTAGSTPQQALALLLDHDIRTLPVLDHDGRPVGTVGLRELAGANGAETLPIATATLANPSDPAIGLLPKLTDGMTHAVVIVDDAGKIAGIISQTDLLATLGKSLARSPGGDLVHGSGQGI